MIRKYDKAKPLTDDQLREAYLNAYAKYAMKGVMLPNPAILNLFKKCNSENETQTKQISNGNLSSGADHK